jgi:hypothetical protein
LNAVEDDVDYTPLVSPVSSLDDLSSSTELLESLGEEDDDEDEESSDDDEDRPSLNAVEDDVDYTPLVSPVSSLDDLSNSTHHHHHHPHYNYSFQDDALPYYDAEEEEDYTMASVPDAIDDTSDDETCSMHRPPLRWVGPATLSCCPHIRLRGDTHILFLRLGPTTTHIHIRGPHHHHHQQQQQRGRQ